jgi:hypothetical protein
VRTGLKFAICVDPIWAFLSMDDATFCKNANPSEDFSFYPLIYEFMTTMREFFTQEA